MNQNDSFKNLTSIILTYHPQANISLLKNAYAFADMAYVNNKRIDGSPLMQHALETAHILADIQVDEHTIAAGLLHDVIHETDIVIDDLSDEFDTETIKLIAGISKLKTYTTKQSELAYAQQLRNLFLATTEDIRVVLVRLAEKIHNLRTINSLPEEKQRVVAQKAIDIYAPLADLLGVQKFKRELEDRAFEILKPEESQLIQEYYNRNFGSQHGEMDLITSELANTLLNRSIPHSLYGRMKARYSTYRKFLADNPHALSLEQYLETLHDKIAFTVIAQSPEDCYRCLSTLRREFPSAKNIVKDYIANPKPNGYRSIHTNIAVQNDIPCEVQIKTRDMHEFNEHGPAAHAFYKLIGRKRGSLLSTPENKIMQIKELLNWKDSILNENQKATKLTTFHSQIYVFTPKADVIELPNDATPIDFAYHIHTKIGDGMRGAYVNGKFVGIDHTLKNGDVCEILSHKGRRKPSADWLRIAKTASARSQIRKSLLSK